MSTIKELLEKQAFAVKENSKKLKQAEELEKKAAALRAEANKPVRLDLKEIRKAKDERLERFGQALFDSKTKAAEDLLTANGWQRDGAITQPKNETGNVWINPKKPGMKIEIKGLAYVVYKNDVQESKGPLPNLETYLKK